MELRIDIISRMITDSSTFWGRLINMNHLLLATCLVHVSDRTTLCMLMMILLVMMYRLEVINGCRGLTHLVRHSQMRLVILPVIHLDRRRSRTLCLVCDLYLTFANLYRSCIVLSRYSSLLVVRYLWEPLARSTILLLIVSLSDAHSVALRENTLGTIEISATSYGHSWVISHFPLLDYLLDVRCIRIVGNCSRHISKVSCHATSRHFNGLRWFRQVFLIISRKMILNCLVWLLALIHIFATSACNRCSFFRIMLRQLTVIKTDYAILLLQLIVRI